VFLLLVVDDIGIENFAYPSSHTHTHSRRKCKNKNKQVKIALELLLYPKTYVFLFADGN